MSNFAENNEVTIKVATALGLAAWNDNADNWGDVLPILVTDDYQILTGDEVLEALRQENAA